MSRRAPNPAADRATQNQATIKTLLKLEGNKTCADCKRNKHPRWASWNLGIFICIRCSGIHRGMGTHISRVKSVDLDAWTDEQLQSVVQWGNTRANKYWEAKLAPGHVPSEAKIENFIRTKYDSKRWAMDGGKPDPSTLDAEGDDDIPLSIVQEKEKLAQQRAASASGQSTQASRQPQSIDLFGDDISPAPRPKTTTPSSITRAPPPPSKGSVAAPKVTKPGESLLGLDFLGNQPSDPGKSASASTLMQSSGPSRPDLKQSILSLYSSAPRPQPQAQHSQSGSIGVQSPQQSNLGGMDDAFSGLNFGAASPGSSRQMPVSKPSAFSDLGKAPAPTAKPSQVSPGWGGGGFFDSGPKPVQPNQQQQQQKQRTFSNSSFGAFDSAPAPAPKPSAAPQAQPSSALGDMFDFGPSSQPAVSKPAVLAPTQDSHSVFNLSKPGVTASSTFQTKPISKAPTNDPFGANNVWGAPEASPASFVAPKPAPNFPPVKAMPVIAPSNDNGWGNSPTASGGFGNAGLQPGPPKVTADEDFGGWSSAAPVSPVASASAPKASKPAASSNFGGSDDLFSNVWE